MANAPTINVSISYLEYFVWLNDFLVEERIFAEYKAWSPRKTQTTLSYLESVDVSMCFLLFKYEFPLNYLKKVTFV